MHTEKVLITPQIARMFLERNTANRKVRQTVVNAYAADMKNGRFLLMPHGIVFLKDGTLADGQHRLLAIVQSETSQEMMVTYGAEPEIQLHQDRLALRQVHDNLIMTGHDWADTATVAILKMAIKPSEGAKVLTLAGLANVDERLIDCVFFAKKSMGSNKLYLTTAPILAAIAVALYADPSISRDRIVEFCNVIYGGFLSCESDYAAVVLRNYLLKEGANLSRNAAGRNQSMITTQACLADFLAKKPIRRRPNVTELIWPKLASK